MIPKTTVITGLVLTEQNRDIIASMLSDNAAPWTSYLNGVLSAEQVVVRPTNSISIGVCAGSELGAKLLTELTRRMELEPRPQYGLTHLPREPAHAARKHFVLASTLVTVVWCRLDRGMSG
jgi:hypothetical protein